MGDVVGDSEQVSQMIRTIMREISFQAYPFDQLRGLLATVDLLRVEHLGQDDQVFITPRFDAGKVELTRIPTVWQAAMPGPTYRAMRSETGKIVAVTGGGETPIDEVCVSVSLGNIPWGVGDRVEVRLLESKQG